MTSPSETSSTTSSAFKHSHNNHLLSSNPNSQQLSDDESAHKYTFKLELIKLQCMIPFACEIKLIWSRGGQQIENHNEIHTAPNSSSSGTGEIPVNETYCNKSTVLYNRKAKTFKKKESKIILRLIAKGHPKNVGEYVLNLCQILDPYNIKESQTKEYRVKLNTEKLPCELLFKLTAEYFQEMTAATNYNMSKDQKSIGSGVVSYSSATSAIKTKSKESPLTQNQTVSQEYSTNYFTKTTTIQNPFATSNSNNSGAGKDYIERKNLFLYEAPSKDNQSICSYTSYNTATGGRVKQSSQSKIGRNPTAADQTQENYNTNKNYDQNQTPSSAYNKGSQQQLHIPRQSENATSSFDTRSYQGNMTSATGSKPVSSNTPASRLSPIKSQEYEQHNNNHSVKKYNFYEGNNKTENFEPNSNKQLMDEQSKRSKLEAEVSKLNIYVKEQSNKLTQYISENTRLKEELSRLKKAQEDSQLQGRNQQSSENSSLKQHISRLQQQLNKTESQNNQMHNRTYELNNELRELHRNYENSKKQNQHLQGELRKLGGKAEHLEQMLRENDIAGNQLKSRQQEDFEFQLDRTKKQYEERLQNLQDELEHVKDVNHGLREGIEKERRRAEQLQQQFREHSHHSALEQESQKKREKEHQRTLEQRLGLLEEQSQSLKGQIREREEELFAKKEVVSRLERTNEEYKNKILHSEGEKNSLLQENIQTKNESEKLRRELSYLNQDLMKVKDEKSAEFEHRNGELEKINSENLIRIESLEREVEQHKKNYAQLSQINEAYKRDLEDKKNELCRLDSSVKSLKEYESKYLSHQRASKDREGELSYAKQENNKLIFTISELESRVRELVRQNEGLTRENTEVTQRIREQQQRSKQKEQSDVDVNQILRESVQMQVELKFKTDELLRLKNIEEQYDEAHYQCEMERKNRSEVEEELQRQEKVVKEKNKLYLIEVEKNKLIQGEKSAAERELEGARAELKQCQAVIFNGDKQVKEMEAHIRHLEAENSGVFSRLEERQQEVESLKAQVADTSRFDAKVRALEQQIAEKGDTVKLLTVSLANSQKEAQEQKSRLSALESELKSKSDESERSYRKCAETEEMKNVLSNELQKILNERKGLELKNETIMEELHGLKKRFQEEKGKSSSSAKNSEEQVKIRQLMNELDKKEKAISKLTKEKLQIEEENINLHVQVMKKLSEMEKTSSGSNTNITAATPKS